MTIKPESLINFSYGHNEEMELLFWPGVFMPNTTTKLLIQAVQGSVSEPVSLLDLGCGTGVVGIALRQHGLTTMPISASDVSEAAVCCSKANFLRYGCEADVRSGTLFQPWADMKFDVIVDDISGISQSIAEVSPWFPGVPCDTGDDGLNLVVEVVQNSSKYLNIGGKLFFPVISLSNVDKILKTAREQFHKVELVGRQDWPLPVELKAHLPLLKKLNAEGSIKLEEKFGMILCYTEVYCAMNPIY